MLRIVKVARLLPSAAASYLEADFVMNLQETVLDYQMNTKTVVQALQRYKDNRWSEIRTIDDLEGVFARLG